MLGLKLVHLSNRGPWRLSQPIHRWLYQIRQHWESPKLDMMFLELSSVDVIAILSQWKITPITIINNWLMSRGQCFYQCNHWMNLKLLTHVQVKLAWMFVVNWKRPSSLCMVIDRSSNKNSFITQPFSIQSLLCFSISFGNVFHLLHTYLRRKHLPAFICNTTMTS